MKKLLLVLPCLFMLAGCLDVRPTQNPTGPSIVNQTGLPVPKDQQAIQQNIQAALGIGFGKLSDDLVKASIDAKDLLHTEIGTLKTDITAMVDAKVQGMAAGITGKIDQTTNDLKQNLQAGRDVNNVNQQYTKEVMNTVITAILVTLGVVVAIVGGICFVLVRVYSKQTADAKQQIADRDILLKTKQAMLERALTLLPPESHDRVFPKS